MSKKILKVGVSAFMISMLLVGCSTTKDQSVSVPVKHKHKSFVKKHKKKSIQKNIEKDVIVVKRIKVRKSYIVQRNDNLTTISKKLHMPIDKLIVSKENKSSMHPGDKIEYIKTIKRFVKKQKQNTKNTKFCFKDARSIHYRSSQRCK